MRKTILSVSLFTLFIFLCVFSSAFLPQIEFKATIQPRNRAIVHAQEPNNSSSALPDCVVLSRYDVDKIADEINLGFARGYRLIGFSTLPVDLGLENVANERVQAFAALCKE